MYIISHRGHNCNNSFMGILGSLIFSFPNKNMCFGEMDIIWTGNNWMICHDFNSRDARTPFLKDFVDYLHCLKKKWRLILDIKWDMVYNKAHCEKKAFYNLSLLLTKNFDKNILLQLTHEHQVDILKTLFPTFKIGILLDQFKLFRKDVDFIDIAVSSFTTSDIESIIERFPNIFIIGFTCRNFNDVMFYRYLFKYLHGLVCDVYFTKQMV